MRSRTARIAPRLPYDHGEPIWRCRFDVLAVAVFMLAGLVQWYAAPQATHAIVFDLPMSGGATNIAIPDPPVIRIGLAENGRALANGRELSHLALIDELAAGRAQRVEPLIVFDPHPDAAYGDAAAVMAIIWQSGLAHQFCFARKIEREQFGRKPEMRLNYFRRNLDQLETDIVGTSMNECPEHLIESVWPS